jgi:DNA polymerase I
LNYVVETVQNSRHYLLDGVYAAIDTEYQVNSDNKSKPYTIFAASVVDSEGRVKVKHVSDFQDKLKPEEELVIWLMEEMLKYKLTIGWYSMGVRLQKEDGTYEGKDSDLKVIDSVCKFHNIPSIISYNLRGIPFVGGYDYELRQRSPHHQTVNKFNKYYHVDLYQIYKKPLVKSIIYQNKYRDLSLDTVCRSILNEGKYENLNGVQIQKLSKEKQLEYVTQDSRLVMKLSQYDNFKILDLMNAISIITDVPFDRVCHTGIWYWWTRIIERQTSADPHRFQSFGVAKRKYTGAYVIEPKIGFYDTQAVYVLDVKSLYPSMMIEHNISFETTNCECCKYDREAKIDFKIMNLINSSLGEKEKREHYWICKRLGIVPKLLQQFREERFRQQDLGNEPMQLALKNLINGCYGLFGSAFFEFSDYRVAELTTAFGRQIIQYMQHVAKDVYEFDIIYGDTDSIFVTNVKNENDIKKFISECSLILNLDIEESEVFKKFLIIKKKHYIGIPLDESKDLAIKGMEGIKGDRPSWIQRIQRQLADDIKNDRDPTISIRNEYRAMEEGIISLAELSIKLTLKKNPRNYKPNSLQRKIGLELEAEQGDILKYYKSRMVGGGTISSDLLCRQKYLQMLKSTVGETLHVMGYSFDRDVAGCKRLDDFHN